MGDVEIAAGAGAGVAGAVAAGPAGTTAADAGGELAGGDATGAAAGGDEVTAGPEVAGAGEAAAETAGLVGPDAVDAATERPGAAVVGAGTWADATEAKTSASGIDQTLARPGHASFVDRFEPLIPWRRALNSDSPAASSRRSAGSVAIGVVCAQGEFAGSQTFNPSGERRASALRVFARSSSAP
jgi:hypothetical protein